MRRTGPSLIGQSFGRLTVLECVGVDKAHRRLWRCSCVCGNFVTSTTYPLRSGNTKSCGCLHRDVITVHGMARSPEYAIWAGMVQRCTNPKERAFLRYGGRGITVCERWLSFENFIADMRCRPSSDHSIDRIDNDGPCATPEKHCSLSLRGA